MGKVVLKEKKVCNECGKVTFSAEVIYVCDRCNKEIKIDPPIQYYIKKTTANGAKEVLNDYYWCSIKCAFKFLRGYLKYGEIYNIDYISLPTLYCANDKTILKEFLEVLEKIE